MAFSFNKRFPRIPALPPKTQFIKMKFVNQCLDLLNIFNIFRDHRVTCKIPLYFENLDPPLICYQYKSPIRNIIFNYNQAKEKYRGVFEIQKSGDKTSSGEIGLDIRTHASPKVGQDQVSGGVSVLCWHAAPVAYVLWKPCTIR